MITRRIREHAASHNWFSVAIDLAIVVVGVFLGTQANNWNEARIDRERAHSYRERLIEDLRATELGAQASTDYYGDVRTHALAALRGLDRPVAALGTPFLVDAYQATQIFPRNARHSTYDEILASGDAELLGPPALRERVANFYWRMDGLMSLVGETPPYRERMRSLLPYAVQAGVRARCDESLRSNGRGLVTPRLPATCPIDLDPALVADAVRDIRSAPGLKQDLTRVVVDLDAKLLQFGKLKAGAQELRKTLAETAA